MQLNHFDSTHIGGRIHIHEVLAEPSDAEIDEDASLSNENRPSTVSHDTEQNVPMGKTLRGDPPDQGKNEKHRKKHV